MTLHTADYGAFPMFRQSPDLTWRRPVGRPRSTWIHLITSYTGLSSTYTLTIWRHRTIDLPNDH